MNIGVQITGLGKFAIQARLMMVVLAKLVAAQEHQLARRTAPARLFVPEFVQRSEARSNGHPERMLRIFARVSNSFIRDCS
jgi:hypothetical protein